MKKVERIIIPVVAMGIIAAAGLGTANIARAQSRTEEGESLIQKIATRFNLNEDEVRETFGEYRYERGEKRHENFEQRLEERLQESVNDGEMTSDQMYAMLEKHEELEGDFDDLYDLSPEDRREAMSDIHEEMEVWAQINDIDMEKIGGFERRLHQGDGKFMHKLN